MDKGNKCESNFCGLSFNKVASFITAMFCLHLLLHSAVPISEIHIFVVVNFLSQVICVFLLFLRYGNVC